MKRYGIGLIPDKESTALILEAYQKSNGKLIDEAVAQNLLYLPLIQTFFKSDSEPKKILKSIIKSIRNFNFKTNITNVTSTQRYQLKINVDKAKWLSDLQELTINICYPLIDTTKINKKKRYAGNTIQEVNNYFTFGYRYIEDAFKPFLRLHDYNDTFDLFMLNNDLPNKDITFSYIAFYEVSKHKTLERIIAKKKLPAGSK